MKLAIILVCEGSVQTILKVINMTHKKGRSDEKAQSWENAIVSGAMKDTEGADESYQRSWYVWQDTALAQSCLQQPVPPLHSVFSPSLPGVDLSYQDHLMTQQSTEPQAVWRRERVWLSALSSSNRYGVHCVLHSPTVLFLILIVKYSG